MKKRLIILLSGMITMLLLLIAPSETIKASEAAGSSKEYIAIYTKEDLDNVRNQLDANYILMDDICFTEEDFSGNGDYYNGGQGWIPIGANSDTAFTGVFDGNGHYIEGIRITVKSAKSGNWGLFGYNKGTIFRVGLVDQRIKIHVKTDKTSVGTNYTGAVAGYNVGQITECYTQGEVESVIETKKGYGGTCAGGIAGMSTKTISNCYSTSDVRCTANNNVHIYGGGICGHGNAENCYTVGNVVVSVLSPGTAYRHFSAVAPGKNSVNCYGIEEMMRDDSFQSDFEGKAKFLSEEKMRCQESFEGFDFSSVWKMNDESGYPYPVLKNVSHVEMKDNTEEFAGGIGTVYRPYLIETTNHLRNVRNYLGAYYVLVSDLKFEGAAEQQQWQMIGTTRMDSFYGEFDGNGHVVNGLQIDAQTDSCMNAGLFGYSEGSIRSLGVVNGKYRVTVNDHKVDTSKSDTYVGGIAGVNRGVIEECYNTNAIAVIDEVNHSIYHAWSGGISGYSRLAKNCYNTGYIMATGNYPEAAGISPDGEKVANSYNMGVIQQIDNSTANAAGICTRAYAKVVNSYSVPVPEYQLSEAGTSFYEEVQMKNKDSYIGFDFSDVWEMDENYPYPQLRSVPHVYPEENNVDFAGGNGTKYNPYIIETKKHLENIRLHQDAYFIFGKDIDLEDSIWKTIASKKEEAFCGSIDGNGYRILNMRYEMVPGEGDHAGFIGYNLGEIRNLTFENCSFVFKQLEEEKNYQGAICGYNGIRAEIQNCRVLDSEIEFISEKNDNYIGGIVGYNNGEITDTCYVGSIYSELLKDSRGITGGIVGENDMFGKIENCYVNGSVLGKHDLNERNYIYWGGIAGSNSGQAIIRNCFCTGNFRVTGTAESKANAYMGVISGFNADKGTIENVYHYVDMSETNTKTGSIYALGYENKVKNVYYSDILKADIYQGTGLDSKAMNDERNFTGFDFESTWIIVNADESAYCYPQLRMLPYAGKVAKFSLEECEVISEDSLVYTGNEINPEPELFCEGKRLRKETDYTVEYANNVECGIAQIVVRGAGNYEGEIHVNFEIVPCDISVYDVELSNTKYIYNGKACTPEISIDGLVQRKDYRVTYSDNVNAGVAKVYIKGEGNYTGTLQKEFVIAKADISKKRAVLPYTSCTYSGKAKKPVVRIANLSLNKHYSVQYKNNVKVGTATVTIIGKGNYSGKITKTFKINPKATSISSLKSSKRGFTVKWKKSTIQTTGYQIQYSMSSAFKSKKMITVSNNKTISKKVSNLSAKKKYYVRVRTYKTVNGKKYYSEWSAKKTVTTK